MGKDALQPPAGDWFWRSVSRSPFSKILYPQPNVHTRSADGQIPSLETCACSVVAQRRRQNTVKIQSGTQGNSRVCHWCSGHILTSVIYYWTDTRQHGIYFFLYNKENNKKLLTLSMLGTISAPLLGPAAGNWSYIESLLFHHCAILPQKNAQNMPCYYTVEQGKNTDWRGATKWPHKTNRTLPCLRPLTLTF